MNPAKYLVLVFVLLHFAVACSAPISNSTVPAISQTEVVPTPIDEKPEIEREVVDKGFVKIQIQKNAPAEIINVSSVNGKSDLKKGVEVEVKNVSDKAIYSVYIGISPQLNCSETLMVGDIVVNSSNSNSKLKLEIKPTETILVQLVPDLAKSLTYRKCTKLNPQESGKAMVYVWGVDFSDGTC